MALVVNDRVKETSTTTGTVTLNLAGAEQGYETFVSGISAGNTTFYAIENNSAGEFEVGIGTVNATVTYTVTVANPGSGNKYYLDGSLQTSIDLAETVTYVFNMDNASNASHPMKFSTTSDGTHNSGSSYNTGVVYKINGASVSEAAYVSGFAAATTRAIEITVASSAPTLYTYCHYHSGMGFTATTAAVGNLTRDTVISSSNSDSKVDFSAGTKNVFCTLPASRAMSPSMTATDYLVTHATTLSQDQTIASGVLAGPVTVTGTQTITGTVVVI